MNPRSVLLNCQQLALLEKKQNKTKPLVCSINQFLWCKYSYHDQSSATGEMSPNMVLVRVTG